MKILLKFLILVSFSFFVGECFADEIEAMTQHISEQVMSPYCPGRTLSSCPSDEARKLRFQISDWLTQGYSEGAVKRRLIGIYGSDVIGEPEFRGFGKIAWLSPFVIIIISLLVLITFMKRKRFENKKHGFADDNFNVEDRLRDLGKI